MDTTEFDPFRPRRIEEMAGASDWIRLRSLVEKPDAPHLIVAGLAGIGKSCALRLALASKITLWLHCSQDPSLRDNRERIKAAARQRGASWIVLEHADMLHTDAQAFLRRIIETPAGTSRFVLEVRDVAAIAEPLLSRTVLYTAPSLVSFEIRSEIRRRNPAVTMALATELARQSAGNIRWAVLQGLAGGTGMVDAACNFDVKSWADVLRCMETIQQTGSSPRVVLGETAPAWERPGGACPWALAARSLAAKL